MLSSLRVCEIGSVILMDCEAETALKRSDMILEEIGVFVEVDRLKCKLS